MDFLLKMEVEYICMLLGVLNHRRKFLNLYGCTTHYTNSNGLTLRLPRRDYFCEAKKIQFILGLSNLMSSQT